MPAVCLMVGALFIKACAQWYQLQENPLAQGLFNYNLKFLICQTKYLLFLFTRSF